jgi:hypothetical protein
MRRLPMGARRTRGNVTEDGSYQEPYVLNVVASLYVEGFDPLATSAEGEVRSC